MTTNYVPGKGISTIARNSSQTTVKTASNEFENMSTVELLRTVDALAIAMQNAGSARSFAALEEMKARRNAALRIAATRNDYC